MQHWKRFAVAVCLFLAFVGPSCGQKKDDAKEEATVDTESIVDTESWEYIKNHPEHPRFHAVGWNHTDYELAKATEELLKKLMPLVIRHSSEINLSGPCMAAFFKMILALRKQKPWAYRIIDAWGVPASGLLEGALGHVGDYDECVDTDIPDLKDPDGNMQRGKYCLATFVPLLPKKPQLYTLFHEIPELVNVTSKQTSFAYTARNAHWFYLLKLRMGICVPSACTAQDVYNIAEQIPKQMKVKGDLEIANCETKQYFHLENDQIAIVSVFSVMALLLIIGTALDVITILRQGDDPEPLSITKKTFYKLLVCFSVYTNYKKLINVEVKEENKHLSAVNGMRFITVTWVIVGHSYLYADYNMMKQGMRLRLLPPNFLFQIIANAMLTVDTFILISGMLVTYGILKQQEKRKGLNIFMYIFHRLWRLTPPYAVVIALLLMSPILASGPVWKITLDPLINKCKANWWTNMLYVNNYVNAYEYCLEHTWYLAVDMQLHIVGLFCFLPLIKWPKLGAVVGVILFVGFSIVAAIVNLIHDLPPSPLGLYPDPDDRVYVEVPNYFKPYGHAGPYFVGVFLGWIIATKPKLVIPRSLRIAGWLFFTALQLTVMYGAYPWNNGNLPGPTVSALYAGTSKTVWSLGIFWVLLVCCTGNGGVVNDILSWKAWVPMARLSYCFYLVHPLVIWIHEAFGHTSMYTSHYFWIYNMLGHYMISMVTSLVLSMSFEAPFLSMEKVLFGGGGNRESKNGEGSKRNHSTPPMKKISDLPSYDSEMRSRTYNTNSKHHQFPEGQNGGHNGLFRNGREGLYRPDTENGRYKGIDNGAFCRL